jgi:hypothetical protein
MSLVRILFLHRSSGLLPGPHSCLLLTIFLLTQGCPGHTCLPCLCSVRQWTPMQLQCCLVLCVKCILIFTFKETRAFWGKPSTETGQTNGKPQIEELAVERPSARRRHQRAKRVDPCGRAAGAGRGTTPGANDRRTPGRCSGAAV